jgi:hypothetical protein
MNLQCKKQVKVILKFGIENLDLKFRTSPTYIFRQYCLKIYFYYPLAKKYTSLQSRSITLHLSRPLWVFKLHWTSGSDEIDEVYVKIQVEFVLKFDMEHYF